MATTGKELESTLARLAAMAGVLVSEEEVEPVAEKVRELSAPDYIDEDLLFDDEESELVLEPGGNDPLMDQAIEVVAGAGKASASYLQRKLKIGYQPVRAPSRRRWSSAPSSDPPTAASRVRSCISRAANGLRPPAARSPFGSHTARGDRPPGGGPPAQSGSPSLYRDCAGAGRRGLTRSPPPATPPPDRVRTSRDQPEHHGRTALALTTFASPTSTYLIPVLDRSPNWKLYSTLILCPDPSSWLPQTP